jgi:hypothetical protein
MNQGIIDYILNKFCPLIIVTFIVFYNFGFGVIDPYIVLGMTLWISKFNYKVGYAMGICESKGLL